MVRDLIDGPHVFEVRAVVAPEVRASRPRTRSRSTPSRRTRRRSPSPPTARCPRGGVDAPRPDRAGGRRRLRQRDAPRAGQDREREQRRLVLDIPNSPRARTSSPRSRRTRPATSQPSAPLTVYMHSDGPTATIHGPDVRRTTRRRPSSVSTDEPGAFIRVRARPGGCEPCESPVTLEPLADGEFTLTVRPTGADNVVGAPVSHPVHRRPHAAGRRRRCPARRRELGDVHGRRGRGRRDAGVPARRARPGGPFAPCAAPQSFSGLAPGDYGFHVRATDGAGNVSETARAFTIAQLPAGHADADPDRHADAAAGVRETAVARPVQREGERPAPGHQPVRRSDGSESIPIGSKIDAKRGRVDHGRDPAGPAAAARQFYGGIFLVTQRSTLVDLRLRRGARAVPAPAPAPRRPASPRRASCGATATAASARPAATARRRCAAPVARAGHVHEHAHPRRAGRRHRPRQRAAQERGRARGQALHRRQER